jgi:hypothetical protein
MEMKGAPEHVGRTGAPSPRREAAGYEAFRGRRNNRADLLTGWQWLRLPGSAQLVGQARRFRDPIAPRTTGQGKPERVLQPDPVPHAHEDRADGGPRAERRAHDLVAVYQGSGGAAIGAGRVVRSEQEGLGHAERGPVQQNAQVAGETESAGVRQPLAVGHQHVGADPEGLQCREDRRKLPEGKEARHVGEAGRVVEDDLVHRREVGELNADIDAGNRPDRLGEWFLPDERGESLLDRTGLLGRHRPGMQVLDSDFHRLGGAWTVVPRLRTRIQT